MLKQLPTITDLISVPTAADPQIAPNGRFIAYTITTPNWEKNSYISQLWRIATGGGTTGGGTTGGGTTGGGTTDDVAPQQLTFAEQSSHSPRWSPDSQWLAFVSQRGADKAPQLYRLAANGGEAERLTTLETAVSHIDWSPNGRFIALLAPASQTSAAKTHEETFGSVAVEDDDYTYLHLWLVDGETKQVRQLTSGQTHHLYSFDWSPNSQQIVFHAATTPNMEDYDQGVVYRLDIDQLTIHALTETGYSSPKWSPDGQQIACLRSGTPSYSANNRLEIMTVTGTFIQQLAASFDEHIDLLAWRSDGLYFQAQQRTEAHLFHLDPATDTISQRSPSTLAGWVQTGASWAAEGGKTAVIAATRQRINELYLLDGDHVQRLTDHTGKTADWPFHEAETITWQSGDGSEIEGVLHKPANFDPTQQHPLLVVIHGGPTVTSYTTRLGRHERLLYPFAHWLDKGAIILQPNYRGSAGYGEAFRMLNHRNLGLGDYADVISGVEALLAKGWVDPTKIGAMGWSQGGYISAFITTYSDRFTAVSVGAGISNWMTYYVNTDIHPFTRKYLDATPWQDKEIYETTSPMTYINNAQTPTLIQHGERDVRVPLPNARELYQGLRDVGVETRLVVYPSMGHGPSQPKQSRHIMQDNLDWFNRWIFGEEPAETAAKPAYVVLETATDTVQDQVAQFARRDTAAFYQLTANGGLKAETADQPLPVLLKQQLSEAEITAVSVYATISPENLSLLGALFTAVSELDTCTLTLTTPPS